VDVTSGGVVASSSTRLQGLELLGGLIAVEEVTGAATAAVGGEGKARADAAGLRVGEFEARVGPGGIRVDDARLGPGRAAALTDAVRAALSQAGLRIGPGRQRVHEGEDGMEAEAYAFSIDLRRQVLPDQLPEGTAGDDVVRVPLGYARAEAAVARVAVPAEVSPAPPIPDETAGSPPPAGPGPVSGGGVPAPSAGSAPPSPPPPSTERLEAVATKPAAGFSDLGVPAVAVVVVVLGGIGATLGLTWLRVNELLGE
jgi:hypothetical protein